MPPMMPHHHDADAAGDFPEKEVVREPPQIDPPPASSLEVKALRMGDGLMDERVQFLPELMPQLVI
jgi:hypothetical protein